MSGPRDHPVILIEEEQPAAVAEPRRLSRLIETDDDRRVMPSAYDVPPTVATPPRVRGVPWPAIVAAGGAGLLTVMLARWVSHLVADNLPLGIIGATFASMTVVGALAWTTREFRAIARLRDVTAVRNMLDWQHLPGERAAVRERIDGAVRLLARLKGYDSIILEWQRHLAASAPPSEMLEQFEVDLLRDADARAAAAAKRAAADAYGLIALSPTGLTDAALFVARATRLLREIAEAYGHRPTAASIAVLGRRVLKDAGLVSVGDFAADFAAGALGGKAVEKISMMTAEGAIASLRMSKFGVLAMECCRPIPFHPDRRPRAGIVLPFSEAGR